MDVRKMNSVTLERLLQTIQIDPASRAERVYNKITPLIKPEQSLTYRKRNIYRAPNKAPEEKQICALANTLLH